ncbi:MAG: J domain-containing protein [Patescibacteria group bacterium]
MEDYYKILGIQEGATEDEVKKKFRELAKKHHPDVGGDANKFKKIVEAYKILSDKKLRTEYDTRRKFGGNVGFGGDIFGNMGDLFRGQNFDDLLGGLFGDLFDTQQYQNLDIMIDVEMEIPELTKGQKKSIIFQRKIICIQCSGSGSETKKFVKCNICNGAGKVNGRSNFLTGIIFESQSICGNCKGDGRIPEKICLQCQGRRTITKQESLTVDLPKGFDPRELIAIPNFGDEDPATGRVGQLVIRAHIKPHPNIRIKGNNLITEMHLSILDILLGGQFELKFFDENVKINIPAGVNIEELVRIPGKGIGRGDLYVQIKLKPIKKLSKKAKESLEQLKDEI